MGWSYAATPAELRLVLSLLRPSSLPNSRMPGAPPRAIIDVLPSLVILHDISTWFTGEMRASSHVLSHYLELVAMGLDFARYISQQQEGTGPTSLALVDGKLDDLCLPVVNRAPKEGSKTTSSDDAHFGLEQKAHAVEPLLPVIAKYFEWVGRVEKCAEPSPSTAEEDGGTHSTGPTRKLYLRSTPLSGALSNFPEEHSFQWREDRALLGGFNEPRATIITHLDGE
ncbi:hypothetical protein CALCODRAFT_3636 [Calocera cornea HHB12733]|uniref:Uncharacterized protein n=1 Tax=Calocera cornea HHB12733 TaxID=1353952 RepID=A0A165K9Z0_9BASI|nr:hypothetical protein CALCODRAFT_3636 [Calocera cornea HHB12733]